MLAVGVVFTLQFVGTSDREQLNKAVAEADSSAEQATRAARRAEAVTINTRRVLCSFKADLQSRVDQANKILEEHPEDPVKVYGLVIPRATLIQQTANQQRSLDALDGLRCKKEEVE